MIYYVLKDRLDGTFLSAEGAWTLNILEARQFEHREWAEYENRCRNRNYDVVEVELHTRVI